MDPYEYIKKGKNILVFGSYGYGNVGTESILAGLIQKIGNKITVISAQPGLTTAIHGCRSVSKIKALNELLIADTVVIGGDELINDDYFNEQSYSNPIWALKRPFEGKSVYLMSLASKILDKRLVFLSLGAGHMDTITSFMAKSLNGYLTVRDKRSLRKLKRIGLKPRILVDPSIHMIKINAHQLTRKAGIKNPYLTITVKNGFTPVDKMNNLCTYVKSLGIQIIAIPMANHPYNCKEQDMHVFKKIKDIIVFKNHDPRIIEGLISNSVALVGTRMHSTIFACKNNIPAICIPYSKKHKYVFDELNMNPEIISTHDELFPALKQCLQKLMR